MMDGIIFYLLIGFTAGAVVMWLVLSPIVMNGARRMARLEMTIEMLKDNLSIERDRRADNGD